MNPEILNMNTSSSTRRLRHREADLAGLLEAAERVFSEKGYHATSIRDIAREAGFSVGGVYQFFPSKDDLYLRVVESQWEFFFGLVDQARQAEGARARLEALTAAMFKTFEQRRGFFRLFLSERGRLTAAFSGLIAERVGAHTRRLREELVGLMTQGADEGTLRGGDPAMLASAYLGMVHNCIFEALSSGAPKPSRSAAEILSLFLDGAAAMPPAAPTSGAG
jgi:AcrR family transcriptional regulator